MTALILAVFAHLLPAWGTKAMAIHNGTRGNKPLALIKTSAKKELHEYPRFLLFTLVQIKKVLTLID